MFKRINTVLKQRPLLVSIVGNTIKTISADVITQKVIEQKEEIDLKRVGLFASFGFAYLGGWQYYLFNKVFVEYDRYMRLKNLGVATRSAVLTFLDLGVHTPLLYYPSFYALKGYVDGSCLNESIKNYTSNFSQDMMSMWQLWFPAQMVNFSYVPVHLRMPFITCVSFAWTIILSMTRGQ